MFSVICLSNVEMLKNICIRNCAVKTNPGVVGVATALELRDTIPTAKVSFSRIFRVLFAHFLRVFCVLFCVL